MDDAETTLSDSAFQVLGAATGKARSQIFYTFDSTTRRLLSVSKALIRVPNSTLNWPQNTLPQSSSALTGFASQNVSPSSWQLWRIDPYWFILPTVMFHPCCRHAIQTTDAVFYLSSSGRSARSSLQSASGRSRFLEPPSGTTCLSTVASAPSLAVFRQRLKIFLFSRSYQSTIIWLMCYYYHSSLLSGHLWSLQ